MYSEAFEDFLDEMIEDEEVVEPDEDYYRAMEWER